MRNACTLMGSTDAIFDSSTVEAVGSDTALVFVGETVSSAGSGGAFAVWAERSSTTGAAGFGRSGSFLCFSGPPRADWTESASSSRGLTARMTAQACSADSFSPWLV